MDEITKEYINCPYCAEEIKAIAKKCKHCGEFLAELAYLEHKDESNINRVSNNTFTTNVHEAPNQGINLAKLIGTTLIVISIPLLLINTLLSGLCFMTGIVVFMIGRF